MKKYILLSAGTSTELESTVNHHIDQGYQPCGGAWEGARGFSQAMILSGIKEVHRQVENTPTREVYQRPRNLHVNGVMEEDVPF